MNGGEVRVSEILTLGISKLELLIKKFILVV